MKTNLKRFIAKNRNSLFFRLFAKISSAFLNAWENVDYNPKSNGEEYVFQKLSGQNFQCIFDVGTNLGHWTLMAKRHFPKAHVHCFEVIDTIFEELKVNLKHTDNVTLNNLGLLNEATERDLHFYPRETGKGSIFDFENKGETDVKHSKFITGDAYLEQHQIKHIDFLKLDVEGSEHLVLEGLSQSLSQKRIDIIQFEYGKICIVTGFLLKDFYNFFIEKGYLLGKIYPNYVDFRAYSFKHEDFRGPNFLAIRKERTDLVELLK